METSLQQRDKLRQQIEAYVPIWTDYRRRNARTEGGDGRLAESFSAADRHMDNLLEELFRLNVCIKTGAQTIEAPIEGVEDGRGSQ